MMMLARLFPLYVAPIGVLGAIFTLFYFFYMESGSTLISWEVSSLSVNLSLSIILDKFSAGFALVVGGITTSVLLFSFYYMASDPYGPRFYLLVSAFVLSMWALIFSPNLLWVMMGWDGLGLSSYLLVVYFQNKKSLNAGNVTAITNRLGDVLIILSLAFGLSGGSWEIISLSPSGDGLFLFFCIMAAAMTKSAQLPFSAWLPAAMAAPTPVSALVHSSTLVTAGVYLLFRIQELSGAILPMNFILVAGSMTLVMAGLSALYEMDFKKIIALSTLSQLGVMMVAIGGNLYEAGFFHMVSHAFFKAVLFMAAGNMIHEMGSTQDLRLIKSSWEMLPLSTSVIWIANLSLMATPFLSGFYSKDLILELLLTGSFSLIIWIMFIAGAVITCGYSIRMIYFSMTQLSPTTPPSAQSQEPVAVFIYLAPLLILSVLGGVSSAGMSFSHPTLPLEWLVLAPTTSFLLITVLVWLDYIKLMMGASFSWTGGMWFLPLFSCSTLVPNFKSLGEISRMNDLSWNNAPSELMFKFTPSLFSITPKKGVMALITLTLLVIYVMYFRMLNMLIFSYSNYDVTLLIRK